MVRKLMCAFGVMVVLLLAGSAPASAQPAPPPPPVVVPDAAADNTMPGGNLMTKIIGWLKWGALGSAVLGVLGGAVCAGIGHFGNNYGAGAAAKKWVLGGAAASVLAGMAVPFVSLLAGAV